MTPGIPTLASLRRAHRRLNRRITTVGAALAAMRGGQCLHLQYQAGRPLWSLSGGQNVSAEVAGILTKNASVVPVGDALFADVPSQTWRFTNDR